MGKFVVTELASREMLPGVTLREVHLHQVMVTFIRLLAGAVVPPHRHPHEQISVVIQGRLKMTVGTETFVLEAGQGVQVPSQVEHWAEALEETQAQDSFSPIREDYVMS
jgi:quercetin dioxygenase-like cupin family protein